MSYSHKAKSAWVRKSNAIRTYVFCKFSQSGVWVGCEGRLISGKRKSACLSTSATVLQDTNLCHGQLLVLKLKNLSFDAVLDDQLGDLNRTMLTET
jgi:hypothetical protein